jgi:hypothetical protein
MNKTDDTGNPPEDLAAQQARFAAHIRNPDNAPAPTDVEDRRMAIYRDLFFSNIRKFLSGNFPVLRRLYSDGGWDILVREFFTEHRCQTPLFPELPREFLKYLQEVRQTRDSDPPFMLELAHYEWVELALSLDEHELSDLLADPEGDLLEGIPVISPLAWLLSYRFPVHRIRPDFQPVEAPEEATHLLAYRNRDDQVKFMQLNDVSGLLIRFLQEDRGLSGRLLLKEIATAIKHPKPELVLEGGKSLMADLRQRDVILGTRPVDNQIR